MAVFLCHVRFENEAAKCLACYTTGMKVVVTGANGTIGKVVVPGISKETGIEVIATDLPTDLSEYQNVEHLVLGVDAVVHLAWETKTDNYLSENINPLNNLMAFNVYKAAIESGVRRVIMASSVHADSFSLSDNELTADRVPTPDSPYGASKVFVEALGRYYASKGLEVICIRFMGLNANNQPSDGPLGKRKWLSHKDCVALVRLCLTAKSVPHNFQIIYGVSNNTGRIHSYANPFGWAPQDRA